MRWREDGLCGRMTLLSDGTAAECDPVSEKPCCSSTGICGDTCDCWGCIDYREVKKWRDAGRQVVQHLIQLQVPFAELNFVV